MIDVSVQVCDLNNYWFLGVGGTITIIGFFVDMFQRRTGNSFSLSVNVANGTNLPVSFASVSGGIPADASPTQSASIAITGATNASPIVVTAASHGMVNGQKCVISGVGGNTAANGEWYVKKASANTIALYSDATLLTAVAGNAAYTSGGTLTPLNSPTYQAVGVIVTFSAPTYFDIGPSPSTDFVVNYANFPQFSNADGNCPLGRVNTS